MVLSGVASKEQAQRALKNVLKFKDAQKPVTPYMHHYFVEVLYAAGMDAEAKAHIDSYWGGMIKLGADTFWEVYIPED